MTRTRTGWWVTCALVLGGCTGDGLGTTSSGVTGDTVIFTLPLEETTYVNADSSRVMFQLYVFTDNPKRTDLWLDGSALVSLLPPYTYEWDTLNLDEGSYEFEVKRLNGGSLEVTDSATIVVDRTQPRVVSITPAESASVDRDEPMVFTFSEPMNVTGLGPDHIVGSGGHAATGVHDTIAVDATWSEDNTVLTVTAAPDAPVHYSFQVNLRGLTDRARNPLPEASRAVQTPPWVAAYQGTTLPPSASKLDGGVASDGTLWIVYTTGTGPDFAVARWTDGDWELVSNITTDVEYASARLLFHDAGFPAVALGARVVFWWEGEGWMSTGYLEAGVSVADWEVRALPGGDFVLARGLFNPERYEIWRGGGSGWTLEDSFFATTSLDVGLVVTDTSYMIAFRHQNGCNSMERVDGGWIDTGLTYSTELGNGSCQAVTLERGGDGIIYAGVNLTQFDGKFAPAIWKYAGGSVWDEASFPVVFPPNELDPSPTGIYALVSNMFGGTVVATTEGMIAPAFNLPGNPRHTLTYDGEILVFAGEFLRYVGE